LAEPFDDLLDQMPRIAEAVSKFPESVQPQAFEALMIAARGEAVASRTSEKTTADTSKRTRARKPRAADGEQAGESRTRRRRNATPSVDRNLELAPKGKKSFRDFIDEKKPKSNYDRIAASVYYLVEVAKSEPVTVDHVYTCYRIAGWTIPSDLANSIQQTASKKVYVDSSDSDDIKLLTYGINRVERELPLATTAAD
jgi:hypothetical protein